MANYLMVNPELYALTFTTSDNIRFDLIKNSVKNIPNSKKRYIFSNNQNKLYVHKEYYEQTINNGLEFLAQNNLESDVFWLNKNDILIPCGYYQVAIATPITENNKETPIEIKTYFETIEEKTQKEVYYSYNFLSQTYNICLKGNRYEDLLLSFNNFVLENGTGPFKTIESISYYGITEQRKFPILVKK